jgi:hypothetical protein
MSEATDIRLVAPQQSGAGPERPGPQGQERT